MSQTDFGFKLEIFRTDEGDRFLVSLPHQCDRWEVAGGDRVQTFDELSQFITQAEQIRQQLRRGNR